LGDDTVESLEAQKDVSSDIVRDSCSKLVQAGADSSHPRLKIRHARAKGGLICFAFGFKIRELRIYLGFENGKILGGDGGRSGRGVFGASGSILMMRELGIVSDSEIVLNGVDERSRFPWGAKDRLDFVRGMAAVRESFQVMGYRQSVGQAGGNRTRRPRCRKTSRRGEGRESWEVNRNVVAMLDNVSVQPGSNVSSTTRINAVDDAIKFLDNLPKGFREEVVGIILIPMVHGSNRNSGDCNVAMRLQEGVLFG
jgi:hypothetical protein